MSLEHGKKRNKNEIKFIKKNTLVLSLCGLLGCALSASAAIDVTVNGATYAITTVDYTGTLSQDLFNTLTSQVWYNVYGPNAAYNFSVAYINAVEASDPNAGTDGAEQNAYNTDFVNSFYMASGIYQAPATSESTVDEIGGYFGGVGGQLGTSSVTEPLIIAEATLVTSVPEPSAYGWGASALVLVCGGVGSIRKFRKTNAA